MTRRNWTIFAAMMIAALFLVGCGSDGDRGMAGPAGPPGPPGEAGEAGAGADTSTLEAAITELQETVDELTEKTDTATTPFALTEETMTIPEILGGKKGTASAADLKAAAAKISGAVERDV